MIKEKKDIDSIKAKGLRTMYPAGIKISVGMATCGLATGAGEVFSALEKEIQEASLDITLSKTGCLGFCQMEPLVDVWVPGMPRLTFKQVASKNVQDIISFVKTKSFKKESILCKFNDEKLLDEVIKKYDVSRSSASLKDIPLYEEVPFFAKQKKIVLRNCGFIDPDSIEEYALRNGYYAAFKTLKEVSPESVVDEIKKSGLRGRGGAGFPTGKKWELCRQAEGKIKYIICNADEGDPGAYMDRSVLEGDPHSVVEGMIIGAYAIGAHKGFIYIRTEYPCAVKRIRDAIQKAREHGFLGAHIFNSGFDFDIEVREGSGAFVCGEETSLIHSIEGLPPEPRQRPPFPVQSGLWGYPTNINNVETWANVPVIIQKGSDWFADIGTEKSKGTKVFSVVGKIRNTGLVEVPMGITLREVLYEIGGGIRDNKAFKAVQTGGPSGGCVPAKFLDTGIDYESLKQAGSIMGSGGMVVLDETTCAVDVAKYFLTFTREESCGKCTPCRDGSGVLLDVINRISEGNGKKEDISFLEQLGAVIKDASLCGLGQTLPNPVLSTLAYFKDEYEAHINDRQCPARVCKKLMSYYIDPDSCQACSLCAKSCPVDAIKGNKDIVYVINQKKCTQCGVCLDVCPERFNAVRKISGKSVPAVSEHIPVKKKVSVS